MIYEIIAIIGFSISLTLALINIYLFRYFKGFYSTLDELKKSRILILAILVALVFHSLYHLTGHFSLPFEHLFEVSSVYIILGTLVVITKRGLSLEITFEIRKAERLRQLMALRDLKDQLSDTSGELIETKNFFNSIIQSSADAIVASDVDKKVTYFSKGAEELFELRVEDVLGTNVMDLYPLAVKKKNERIKRAKKLKNEGFIKSIVMKIITPKNKVKTISLSLSQLKDVAGKVKGTVGVARDITEEVKAANEVAYLKELSDKILAGTPEGLILVNLNFEVTMVNKGFEEITGINGEAIVKKNALEYFKIPDIERLFDAIDFKHKFDQVVYKTKPLEPSEFDIEIKGQKKSLIDFWIPLFDRKGKVEYVLIILQDVTKRKALEENLKEQAEELKHSNDLKDIFTDIMRHDLLNPIGVIKNYIDLLSDEPLDPTVNQSIAAIKRNVNKAVGMIENASQLAKIETVEEIKFEENDLGEILKEAVDTVKSRAEKKEVEIEVAAPGAYPVVVNPFMEDVFLNLLTNAIKYGPEKSVVEAGIEDGGKSWRVYVKDKGEGIEDKYKQTIFTRFERLKREGVKGSGLGLAIVKRIIEMHKGRVWVEDNPESGSIFIVEIPKHLR
jgi:PAS domain S-box-containing protein